jgi:hypothetical protein
VLRHSLSFAAVFWLVAGLVPGLLPERLRANPAQDDGSLRMLLESQPDFSASFEVTLCGDSGIDSKTAALYAGRYAGKLHRLGSRFRVDSDAYSAALDSDSSRVTDRATWIVSWDARLVVIVAGLREYQEFEKGSADTIPLILTMPFQQLAAGRSRWGATQVHERDTTRIGPYACRVLEARSDDEWTRWYLADDLKGLVVRIETGFVGRAAALRAELTNVHVGGSPDLFAVPAGYRAVTDRYTLDVRPDRTALTQCATTPN